MGIKLPSMKDVGNSGFEPVPEGIYEMNVFDASIKDPKKEGGYQYIEFVHQISSGEYEDRRVWDRVSLSPAAAWKLQLVLEAITNEPWRDENMELELKDLMGLQFKALVTQQTYTDKNGAERVSNQIAEYYSIQPQGDDNNLPFGEDPF